MPRISAQDATTKWAQRTKSSTGEYTRGIERVTEAPGVAAARASDAYLQGVQNSMNKWKRNVAAVSLDDWQRKAITKVAGRIAAGVDASMSSTLQATEQNFANIDRALSSIASTPRGTFENNMQRMVGFATAMHEEANK